MILTVTWYIGRDVEEFAFTMPVLGSGDFAIETPEVKIDQSKRYYRIPVEGQEVIAEKGTGTLDGRNYATISFRKALTPKRPGELAIPQMSVQCAAVSGNARGRGVLCAADVQAGYGGARRETPRDPGRGPEAVQDHDELVSGHGALRFAGQDSR